MPSPHCPRHHTLRLLSPRQHPHPPKPRHTARPFTNYTTPQRPPLRIHRNHNPYSHPRIPPLTTHTPRFLSTTQHTLNTTAPPSPSDLPTPPTPTPLPPSTYHALSDAYIETLLARLEEMAETNPSIDVEYSAGVLTLTYPSHGTYVLNKQPPNKQIWLSSPVSGPKRYDWVGRAASNASRIEDGQGAEGYGGESGEGGKQEGEWVYLRDGSTLSGLLEEEVGVRVDDVEGGDGG